MTRNVRGAALIALGAAGGAVATLVAIVTEEHRAPQTGPGSAARPGDRSAPRRLSAADRRRGNLRPPNPRQMSQASQWKASLHEAAVRQATLRQAG